MKIFNIYVGGELVCAAFTEREELTVNEYMDLISHDPNEHEAAILADVMNGASIEIIEEGGEDGNI